MSPHDFLSKVLSRWTKQNAKFIFVLVTATTGVLLVGQTHPTKTIEAERFILKGADGSVKAKLEAGNDCTEFAFYNNAGKVRVAIKVAPDGNGFEMRDDAGRLLALVSVGLDQNSPSSTTSTIAVQGNPGGPGVILNATQGVASARVADSTGHRVWAAESTPPNESR